MATKSPKRLRLMSYMCQDIPCDVFYFMRDVIEDGTGLETDLICENRFSGPTKNRADPFEENVADIVIVHSSDYLRLKEENNPKIELCGAAPVHAHKEADGKPVYFSEVIILTANKDKYKSMKELKGCSWAYSDDKSISGNLVVLNYLRKSQGTNASYFGSIIRSGSHLSSIKMVQDHRVVAAAVDSTVLSNFVRQHPEYADTFTSVASLGPLPVHPILFNKCLQDDIKDKITSSLLSADKADKWTNRMKELQIERFGQIDPGFYHLEEQVAEQSKGMKINMAYY